MALQYRFYRAPQIPGTRPNTIWSKLNTYIVCDGSGADFVHWRHRARPCFYSLARCEDAVHTTIQADSTVTVLSPKHPTLAAVQAWLDTPASLPAGVRTVLEGDGISTSWVGPTTTYRDVLRYTFRQHEIAGRMQRDGASQALNFLKNSLDQTVGSLTAGQRQAAAQWMAAQGVATDWITGSTTVREVMQAIADQMPSQVQANFIDLGVMI